MAPVLAYPTWSVSSNDNSAEEYVDAYDDDEWGVALGVGTTYTHSSDLEIPFDGAIPFAIE